MVQISQPVGTAGRRAKELEQPLLIDRTGPVPLATQLAEQWRDAIASGRLTPGVRLPSSRVLARALGVTRHVVVQAVDELVVEGYLVTRQGSGVTVARDARAAPAPTPVDAERPHRWEQRPPAPWLHPSHTHAANVLVNFRLGEPDVRHWHRSTWRRVWRQVGRLPMPGGYGHPLGEPALRRAIAGYLGRSRGLACHADQVMITSGSRAALLLLCQAALQPGDVVGMEEPGYSYARQTFLQRPATLQPIPVDEDGLCVDQLPTLTAPLAALYCTPSHQYPLGSRLSIPRRRSLLAWARQHDTLLIEDDYDSEFRYDVAPLPALAALDDVGQVAYLGTFSKSLSAALRVGYIVATPALIDRVARLKQGVDGPVSWPIQTALTELIESGELERHIRTMRRIYARKREALTAAVQTRPELCRLVGLEAGLHVFLELPTGVNTTAVVQACAQQGVQLEALSPAFSGPVTRHGLLLGYGTLSIPEIQSGMRIVLDVIAQQAAANRDHQTRSGGQSRRS